MPDDAPQAPSLAAHIAAAIAAYPAPVPEDILWNPVAHADHADDFLGYEGSQPDRRIVARATYVCGDESMHLALSVVAHGDPPAFSPYWSVAYVHPYNSHADEIGSGASIAGALTDAAPDIAHIALRLQLEAGAASYAAELLEYEGRYAPAPPAPEPEPQEPSGPSEDAGLAGLTVGHSLADVSARGTLEPAFARNTESYTIRGRGLLRLEAETSDPNATVRWHRGETVDTDNVFHQNSPTEGMVNVTLVVTAEDGITRRTYILTFRPEAS